MVGPSSGMLLAGDEAAALAVREVRGFDVAAAGLADEPATLPGIVVVDGSHMREAEGNNSRPSKQRKTIRPSRRHGYNCHTPVQYPDHMWQL